MGKARPYVLGWKGILITIALALFFIFGITTGFLNYAYRIELQKMVDKGEIAEAEIVALIYSPFSSDSAYRLQYIYVDENSGITYKGYCGRGDYKTEESDKNRIGEKVEIYIGGYGKLLKKPLCRAVCFGTDLEVEKALIAPCIFIFLFCVYLVLFILFMLGSYGILPEYRDKKTDDGK